MSATNLTIAFGLTLVITLLLLALWAYICRPNVPAHRITFLGGDDGH